MAELECNKTVKTFMVWFAYEVIKDIVLKSILT